MTARRVANASGPWLAAYQKARERTETLVKPLSEADQTAQSMPDASPVKWHLAHTSWFFETFVLKPNLPGYSAFDPAFEYLFNSYYNSIGEQFPRAQRGAITRPGAPEVLAYRHHVDKHMTQLLSQLSPELLNSLDTLLPLGLAHEEQHQELLITDLQHLFSINPLYPAVTLPVQAFAPVAALGWWPFPGGLVEIGAPAPGDASDVHVDDSPSFRFDDSPSFRFDDSPSFRFDNESPRHQVRLYPFALADRLVTNGEYAAFIDAGGYNDPLHWLSEGWAWRCREQISQPLYWLRRAEQWWQYSLAGLHALDPHAPVRHISLFEAMAYAQWCGCRLATEFEWEHAAARVEPSDSVYDPTILAPQPQSQSADQLYNCLWQWTQSQYQPYPGYRPEAGAVGEYNGKFMSNQFVLRGGSCITPPNHIRASYRNFFPAATRWQFSGIRMAKDD